MHIQSYQIHNVLNVYRRQLSQAKPESSGQVGNPASDKDPVMISSQAKYQSIMDKVATNVLKKITSIGPESISGESGIKMLDSLERKAPAGPKENEFVFNTIVGDNQKETRSIAVDNSQVLLNRMDHLARAAVDRSAEHSVWKAPDAG